MLFLKKVGRAQWVLLIVLLLELSYMWCAFSRTPVADWPDTETFFDASERLHDSDLKTIWEHNRPPSYPFFILATSKLGVQLNPEIEAKYMDFWRRSQLGAPMFLRKAGEALRVNITFVAVALNLAGAALWVCLLEAQTAIVLLVPFLLLSLARSFLSYQNVLLAESIMPFFLVGAVVLGVRAKAALQRGLAKKDRKSLATWAALGFAQFLLLISLKPFFKVIFLFRVFDLVAIKTVKTSRKIRIAAVAALLALFVSAFAVNTLMAKSGLRSRMETKTDTLMYEILPAMGRAAPASLADSPKLKLAYDTMYACSLKLSPQKIAHASCAVTLEEGAALYDHLIVRNLGLFVKQHLKKMANVVRYSAWGEDYGHIESKGIGLKKGFGSFGILFTALLAALVTFALTARRDLRQVKPGDEMRFLLAELAQIVVYGFGVVMFGTSTCLGRISLPYVIPAFLFLSAVYWHGLLRLQKPVLKLLAKK